MSVECVIFYEATECALGCRVRSRLPPVRNIVQVLGNLKGLVEGAVNQKNNVEKLVQEKELEIVSRLSPLHGFFQEQKYHFSRQQEGTGQWLLGSEEFREWVKGSGDILWCLGIPGAGKTILTSIVVDKLRRDFQSEGNVRIACIYCDYNKKSDQTLTNLIASIWEQLVIDSQGNISLSKDAKSLYEQGRVHHTSPSPEEVSTLIKHEITIKRYRKVFIIVDALDECSGERGGLLRLLAALKADVQADVRADVHFMFTSRHNVSLEPHFESPKKLEIKATDADLRKYVIERISRVGLDDQEGLRLWEPIRQDKEFQARIVTGIISRTEGMFLLAKLHMDSLAAQIDRYNLEKSLESLPKKLEDTYRIALQRIEGQREECREIARNTLAWLFHARRLLTVEELEHALAVKIGDTSLNEKRLMDKDTLLSICAGLVIIDLKSRVIRLVHYTAKEYFKGVQETWVLDAPTDITVACVTYLSFDAFAAGFCLTDEEFEARLQRNPLYDYAARNWGYHARAASTATEQWTGVERLIQDFLENEANVSATSQAMMASGSYPGYSQRVPRQMTGVHVAVYFGLDKLLLATEKVDLDSKDSGGRTPLSWAARGGHEAVVKVLLATGKVDVDSKDSRYGQTPLSWAAGGGHEAVEKLLRSHYLTSSSPTSPPTSC